MLDDFREWLSDNLRYILLGLAIILILIIAFFVVRLVTGSSGSSSSNKTVTEKGQITEAETENIQQAATEGEDNTVQTEASAQAETAAQGTSSLTKDDSAILTLVKKYYEAAAAKDIATLETICDPWNEEVKESILQNNVIQSYNNISTYSKKGPVDNSFVVYTYYEGKIANIDTEVPSLTMLYLTMNEEGNLVVSDRKASQEVADYIASVSSDADVQALIADVNKKCEEAKASDPALKEFMDSLDSSNAGEGSTAENSEDDASGNNSEMGEMICAAASLNIRQAPDTSSAIMGVLTQGDTVTKIQDAQDGWCQISYNAGSYTIEGYVRSEYLESAN